MVFPLGNTFININKESDARELFLRTHRLVNKLGSKKTLASKFVTGAQTSQPLAW